MLFLIKNVNCASLQTKMIMFQKTFQFVVAVALYYNMQTSPKIIGCVPLSLT